MPAAELSRRVLFTLLQSTTRLGLAMGATRKEMTEALDMAVFREARSRGLKLAATAELLGVSMRKASRLSKRLKQNFLGTDAEVELARRIEFMLWAEPLGEKRVRQALGDVTSVEVRSALDELLSQGRIVARSGRTITYAVTHKDSRLIRDTWMSRLDGLADLIDTVTEAVAARFFGGDPRAFARTVSFRIRGGDMQELQAMYEEQVWPVISRLDGRAAAEGSDETTETMALSLVWAPDGYEPPAVT